MPIAMGLLVILVPAELWVGWLVYKGFRTGVVYMGNRVGEEYRFLDRKERPVLYWLGMVAYLIGMPMGIWLFWSALQL
jgi:hypothetical protein